MTASQIMVGMSELHVAKGAAVFTCLGLGSCIGLCALDPETAIGGMVHIMLPAAFPDKPVDKPGKFADTGLPALLELLAKKGADPSRLLVAYAGGAQVFKFGANTQDRLDVGGRNATAVADLVNRLELKVVAKEVGGSQGRTVTFNVERGEVFVRTVAGGEKLLCNLRR
jgi:chemotaxis protein CheD